MMAKTRMKKKNLLICIVLLSLLCGSGNAIMAYQSQSELILTSDAIVYGKIVDVQSQWNSQKTHIETTAHIQVADAFSGADKSIRSTSTVPVIVLGGTIGDVTEWVEDMPVFVPDTDAFVFLKKRSDGKFVVNGLDKGVYNSCAIHKYDIFSSNP
jgi:hypothetical protein